MAANNIITMLKVLLFKFSANRGLKKSILKTVVFFIALFAFQNVLSQTKSKDSLNNKISHVDKRLLVNLLGVEAGLDFETKISKASTIDFFAGMVVGNVSDKYADFRASKVIMPAIFLEYRNYYYKIKEQKNVGKRIEKMLLAKSELFFPIKNQNYTNILFSQGWGARYFFSKKFFTEIDLGITEHIFYDKANNGKTESYLKLNPLLNFNIYYSL